MPRPKNESGCSIPGCDRPFSGLGFCEAHRIRHNKGADMFAPLRTIRPGEWGEWGVDNRGYIRRSRRLPDGRQEKQAQHRYVMEGVLGRQLLPGENVHHINGVRTDNRPENLELWVTHQPNGQRPEDLVAWAREIMERYDDD
jgi:hypothetical protein